jgi:hypothetical protein
MKEMAYAIEEVSVSCCKLKPEIEIPKRPPMTPENLPQA